MKDSNLAMMANQNVRYEDNGDCLFAPVTPRKPAPRLVAVGAIPAGETKATMLASAEQFNGGQETITMLPTCNTAFVSEADLMNASLDALRCTDADYEVPFTRLTPEQMEEIEKEHIGNEFSTKPWAF